MPTPQKETPTGGSNHGAGVNTYDTGAIVGDRTPSVNASADDYVRDLAQGNTAKLLAKAASFASMHAPHTLWQRRMKVGRTNVTVRLEWPGVLCVYDPATGDKLATSAPGQPDVLQK